MPSHDTTPLLSFLIPRNFPTTHSMGQLCCSFHHFSSVYSFTPKSSCSISSSSLTVSNVLLLLTFLPFHCLQFLSNLPQYSWLYLLSNHPNHFLAINLPSNSPLLNTTSLCSYCTTSSIFCRYSLSNSSIASFGFFKFALFTNIRCG